MSLITLARAAITVAWFVLFVAIWVSAWSRGRRAVHAAAALLPLEDTVPACTHTEVRP